MTLALFVLLPLLLIGVAAATGFGTALLFGGMKGSLLDKEEQLKLALGIAVVIPVLVAASVLVQRLPEIAELYGNFLHYLLHWAGGAFAVGLVFGSIYGWQREE